MYILIILSPIKNQFMDNQTPQTETSGPRLNIKTVLSTYGDFHVKDKTAVKDVLSLTWESPYLVRPSFLLRRPPVYCHK